MIQREIAIYERHGDKLVKSVNFDATMEDLKSIFVRSGDDINYEKVYPINEIQYEKLRHLLPEIANYNLENFEMFMECFTED